MELSEISTFHHRKQRIEKKFCLRISPCGRFYCLMLANNAIIRKISYTPMGEHPAVNFIVTNLKCPNTISTQHITKDFDALYEKSSFWERKTLALNPLLAAGWAENVTVQLMDLQISPPLRGCPENLLIAVQNTMGCVTFFSPPGVNRHWVQIVNVSQELIKKRQSSGVKSFSELQRAVEDHTISAFTWTMTDNEDFYIFCVVMLSGITLVCTFNGQEVKIDHTVNLQIPNVRRIKWFKFSQKFYLVTAAASGQINLFRINENTKECISVNTLWTDSDHLPTDHLEINTASKNALILAVKDCYLLAFVLTPDEKILSRFDELGSSAIVGVTHVKSWEYLVVFSDRKTKHIQISTFVGEFNLLEQEVNNNLPARYTAFGGIVSQNRVFWMFALQQLEPHDIHDWHNPSITVTICAFTHGQSVLDTISDPTMSSLALADCQEKLRIEWFKEVDVSPYYLQLVSQSLQTDDFSVLNLRTRLIYLGSKCGSLKYGHQIESYVFGREFQYIQGILVTIGRFRTLLKLRRHFEITKQLTPNQRIAVQHLKVGIRDFLNIPIPEEYEGGMVSLKEILENSLWTVDNIQAKKSYCEMCKNALCEMNLTCQQGHEMRRCILSNFQVLIVNEAVCQQCNQVILNDVKILREILLLGNADEIICPVCDISIMLN
ncbi:hypothetical protein DMENIID0001_117070 [Sergentomyia squamirostris]